MKGPEAIFLVQFTTQCHSGLQPEYWMGGPGALVVEAGLSMDLGTTAGIQVVEIPRQYPSQLPDTGCYADRGSGVLKGLFRYCGR